MTFKLISLLTFAFITAPIASWGQASEIEDEKMPDWSVPTMAGPQIYAQRDLYKCMRIAATWLSNYTAKKGGCPESSNDLDALVAEVTELMPINPYAPNSNTKTKVRITFDDTLTPPVMEQIQLKPPDSWIASPGTVTIVISHSNDHFLVWGAGMDQRPLCHELTQKLLLIKGKCVK